jgi:exo-1,4-beta-D-glucosaminidase
MKNSVVRSKINTETLEEAWLTVGTELINISPKPVTGNLRITTEGMSLVYPVFFVGRRETNNNPKP